jgi:ClpP class serine protease
MNQLWACEIEHLRIYADKVFRADRDTVVRAAAAYATRVEREDILSVDGDSATIQINGALTKQVSVIAWLLGFGGTTYGDILGAISRIAADDSIKNVTLAIDSPGGTVSGVDEVWTALRALGERKNVIAENRGLMASAAYWIASAAKKIVATSPVAMTGSIGVQMITYDWSEAYKRDGVQKIRIVSKNASNKDPDPTTDDGRAVYQAELDAVERVFVSRVATGRGISDEKVVRDFGQGALLIAKDPDSSKKSAISVEMIDGIIGELGTRSVQKIDANFLGVNSNIVQPVNEPLVNPSEGKDMKLAEILATDSALKAEIEALEQTAYQRGAAETRQRGTQAAAVLASDKYPDYIKTLAAAVLKGEKENAELTGAVGVVDMQREAERQRAAETETDQAGPTPAEPPVTAASNGEVRTPEDHVAAVNQLRAAQGMKEIK